VGDPLSGKSTLLNLEHIFLPVKQEASFNCSDIWPYPKKVGKYKTSKNLSERLPPSYSDQSVISKPILSLIDTSICARSSKKPTLETQIRSIITFLSFNKCLQKLSVYYWTVQNQFLLRNPFYDTSHSFFPWIHQSPGYQYCQSIRTKSIQTVCFVHGASHRPIFTKRKVQWMEDRFYGNNISWLSKKYDYNIRGRSLARLGFSAALISRALTPYSI